MDGLVLQDWITIRGQGGPTVRTVTQGADCWLDLAAYRDLVAWVDVREVSADAAVSVQLTFQTAPTLDEMLFVAMAPPLSLTVGLTLLPMLAPLAQAPLSRFLRWKLGPSTTTTAPWDVTFRCLLAANRPGKKLLTATNPTGVQQEGLRGYAAAAPPTIIPTNASAMPSVATLQGNRTLR